MNWLFLLQGQGAQSGGLQILEMLPLFGGIIVIMYFLVIRPNRRQEQKRREMLSQIKKNDKVLTTGGLFGVVMSVKDHEVVLKVDETQNVKVHVARTAITTILTPDGESAGR